MHLSRLCEEIIIFASQEYKFVELSDDFTTGSSIMPQKKNCDFAELIKGRTGRMYGYLQAMLTMMKEFRSPMTRICKKINSYLTKPSTFGRTQ